MKKHLLLLLTLVAVLSASAQLRNPVVPGFHPDPSVCRVGSDFYLVNSSFQYFPGVPVYHSKDLVNWELIGNVLDRESQLPLKGATSWLGIYAPTIRYNDGTYYMITTNVGNGGNFLVTATDPRGPWSEPVWLKQQGIDPSLYFEDGHCYMVSNPDNTIMLCEINPQTGEQLSESQPLWRGTGGRYPEGPHLYKKDGWYYLLISEGGTELAHKLTIARSRKIGGPYVSNPANPLLTNCSMAGQGMQIQGTGHGDLVQAADGSWWMVFLAYRNFGGSYHHLGRETYLAPVTWEKGKWPVVNGGNPIDTLMQVNTLPAVPVQKSLTRTLFNNKLGPEWVYQQNPIAKNYEQADGRLRLYPHSSLNENDRPTFVGRRQESERIEVETQLSLHGGADSTQTGTFGLSVFQINNGHIDLYATQNGIRLMCALKSLNACCGSTEWEQVPERVRLRITSDGQFYRFYAATDARDWLHVGDVDCSLVSTEVAGGFTGVTIGMMAEGKEGGGYADFYYFDYQEK
ncbi:MAG: glycoside hydrolase family 43 protein [Prevotella sp.]|nr:glycoside hydrolase family 43 protein [Prevotella sp.]